MQHRLVRLGVFVFNINLILVLLFALITSGCVKENRVATESEGNQADTGQQNVDGQNDGGIDNQAGSEGQGGSSDENTDAGTNLMTADAETGPQGGNGGATSSSQRGTGCQSYCDRIETCLVPACPGLSSFFGDEVCDEWCGDAPDSQLGAFAMRECGEFNEVLLDLAPELADFCSDDPIPDVCEDICTEFNECGFEIEQEVCLRICRRYDADTLDCAANAPSCGQLFQCVDDQNPEDQINYDEICEGKCFREFECIRTVCSAGTVDVDDAFGNGAFEQCTQTCIDERPPISELQDVFGGLCVDLVERLRANDPVIDARCDNEPDAVCELLCDKVTACPSSVSREECITSCANWDNANRLCIDNTSSNDCDKMSLCFGDADGQSRCREACDHLQGCLLEACPPQIIPPDYSDDCTAGCLYQPPAQRLVDEYTNTACRQVREQIYQENQGLRPVCDGGQDFRPTAAECTDVCESSLDACIVGGQSQCVGLCRTLTREQYTCAIEDGATCMSIDSCLQQ